MKNSLIFLLLITISSFAYAQPEVYPWSNISGIRVDGELMELNSSFTIVGQDWSTVRKTAKERARYQYTRDGDTQLTNVSIDNFFYNQSVEDLGAGTANIRINFRNEVLKDMEKKLKDNDEES